MAKLNKRLLRGYARRAGVEVEQFGDLGWLIPSGDPDNIPAINVTEWEGNVLLNVLPVVTVERPAARPAVAEQLLRLNAQRPLVKYALEEEWQVLLWVAFPAEAFTYKLFASGLAALQDALKLDRPRLQELAGSS